MCEFIAINDDCLCCNKSLAILYQVLELSALCLAVVRLGFKPFQFKQDKCKRSKHNQASGNKESNVVRSKCVVYFAYKKAKYLSIKKPTLE